MTLTALESLVGLRRRFFLATVAEDASLEAIVGDCDTIVLHFGPFEPIVDRFVTTRAWLGLLLCDDPAETTLLAPLDIDTDMLPRLSRLAWRRIDAGEMRALGLHIWATSLAYPSHAVDHEVRDAALSLLPDDARWFTHARLGNGQRIEGVDLRDGEACLVEFGVVVVGASSNELVKLQKWDSE